MPTFYSGAIAIILSWILSLSLSGCRFGNRHETTTRQIQSDGVSGYYETSPRSLSLCVTTEDSPCVEYTTDSIPSFTSAVMTNPVILLLDKENEDAAYVGAADGTFEDHYFPLSINQQTRALTFEGGTNSVQLFDDPKCTTMISMLEDGKYLPYSVPKVVGRAKILGSMEMKITVLQSFDGECTETLQKMYACYQNRNDCGGANDAENRNRLALVQDQFNVYIELGAMTPEDILKVKNVIHEVQYQ